MPQTLLSIRLAAWTYALSIYCCLAERVTLSMWAGETYSERLKALADLLQLEHPSVCAYLSFIIMPVLLYFLHNNSAETRVAVRALIAPFQFLKDDLCKVAVIILTSSIIIYSFPTIVSTGSRALGYTAGALGCYEAGELIYYSTITPEYDKLGRSLLWYKGSMNPTKTLSPKELNFVAAVYGTSSKQFAELTP